MFDIFITITLYFILMVYVPLCIECFTYKRKLKIVKDEDLRIVKIDIKSCILAIKYMIIINILFYILFFILKFFYDCYYI